LKIKIYSPQLVHLITERILKNGSLLFVMGLSRELPFWRSQWYQRLWSIKIGWNYWVGV